ncbi:Testis-specific serine/threonine-protein kinase 5,Testis-specific serine/threonine-protein kinase 1,Hormonally up-regulated neu tumor-associated kinase homolog B [Mytilus coruscus]|uniref:Testis-specific serine/threonine-protein kinase 5,Testis-specific serine/threonine-protein kinase 1,Hormonally up-regulated neu tumor-associated kinase homolog B n=1 Tax=Mytilus coruscus TaxID=42192 RepID=A0A6J8DRW1_MYTCO|nr:Testis-specific serine/threonine-protein kinase 5,Testis-specific serine/threonine-protein kinase 1,Hormonally up-regulated neu tumor-associated kinase homolog B [Mytilus coruscus]
MKQRSSKGTNSTEQRQKTKSKSIFESGPTTPKDWSPENVKKDCMNHGYRIIKTLGEGAYAKVKLAEVMARRLARNEEMSIKSEFSDGELQVAIKVISKTAVPKEFLLKFLPREVENHTQMPEHPHVVKIFDHYYTHDHVYLVMEYCCNGDLLDLINTHIGTNQKGIGEELSRKLFRQLCEALQHIHMNGVVHRDLKCENVLLDENMNAKLTDFGFSAAVDDPSALLRTSCGSYAYTAPEVIKNKPYEGFKSDVWSLGIILFAMINGRLPFNDAQMLEMDEDMKMQRLRFERSSSFDCMVLIRKLLQYHPGERPLLEDILNDPWITGKKPIPRQLQRPKWINPYQAKKPDVVDVPTIIHMPKKVIEFSPRMRNNTICYRPDASPKTYTESLRGTVTLNHNVGETVTLKSRSGRAFKKRMDVTTVPSRPNTWPRSKDGSPLPTKPGNKPRISAAQQKHQTQQNGPDIRTIARIITERYRQGEMGSKDISKQVPLWLVNQILNSEGEQSEQEKARLFANGIEALTQQDEEGQRSVSPGCPACAMSSVSNTLNTEKLTDNVSVSQKKKQNHNGKPSCRSNLTKTSASPRSTAKSSLSKTQTEACVSSRPVSAKPCSKSQTAQKKQMVNYSSPLPIKKSTKSADGRIVVKQSLATFNQEKKIPTNSTAPNIKISPPSTKVSRGFKFKIMTPAGRAKMCRERKMHAYTNMHAFQDVVWPLPLVHGQSVSSSANRTANASPSGQLNTTPRDICRSDTSRLSEYTEESPIVSNDATNMASKHKLVVHVCS